MARPTRRPPAKRSIFEDVGAARDSTPRPAQAAPPRRDGSRGAVRGFLLVLFALVALMVAVGGLTRLTGSGLSITEWRPIAGALPPLTAADWAAEFDRYRAIPQYEIVNRGMTLGEFQVIYWWEWGHRQLGRLVGVVWLVGLAWLAITRRIPRGWTVPLVGIGALGGLQGAIGWWMVASGLGEGMIAVASYRLAVHLGLAFLILGLLAWWIHALGRPAAGLMQARRLGSPALARLGAVLVALAFLQIVLGALVAGIGAGRAYTDWPLMHGVFFPPEALDMVPVWRNFFENPAMVQFTHRMAGYVLLGVGALTWVLAGASPHRATRGGHDLMMAVLTAQVALGIATVIWGAPWQLAIAHQLTAVALWVVILRARFLARYPRVHSTIGRPA